MSTPADDSDTLELDEDPAFSLRQWHVERAAWVVLAAFLLAAVAGLFGGGLFSGSERWSASRAFVVRYERFTRHSRPDTMEVWVDGRLTRHGEVAIRVTGVLAGERSTQFVTPTPLRVAADATSRTLYFAPASPGEPLVVEVGLLPGRMGRSAARVEVGGESVDVRQFVYP